MRKVKKKNRKTITNEIEMGIMHGVPLSKIRIPNNAYQTFIFYCMKAKCTIQ